MSMKREVRDRRSGMRLMKRTRELIPETSLMIQLTRLNPGLINFGNIKILFMILKPKFMEPEVGVVIRY